MTPAFSSMSLHPFYPSMFLVLIASLYSLVTASEDIGFWHDAYDDIGANVDPHPDPNDEHYEGMMYVGRHHHETFERLSNDHDNGIKYIFGTSFDESHKDVEEADLQHLPYGHTSILHDLATRAHPTKSRAELLQERRHGQVPEDGMPKPFGYTETHPLDGGVVPPKIVQVEPFFLDVAPVTNKEFAKFVKSTYYETEAEKYGWSFVLSSFVDSTEAAAEQWEVDPEAEHWVAVQGAYWRRPEGPNSSYKYREHHPVVHVSHKDAAEYCEWAGKRLPGEWEYEAAARAGHYGPNNRTLYAWGESDDWSHASQYANLWGSGQFPSENKAEDGWRGTSPVKTYPANALGFYDLTGNVWEWMRGGKHKARIVRGASFVDSLDGSFNHAATLGARSTLHGTTTTANVGFRCARSPRKRTEYHYQWHDEEVHGKLTIEDEFGRRDMVPERGWEDQFGPHLLDEDEEETRKRRKVIKRVERLSTEL